MIRLFQSITNMSAAALAQVKLKFNETQQLSARQKVQLSFSGSLSWLAGTSIVGAMNFVSIRAQQHSMWHYFGSIAGYAKHLPVWKSHKEPMNSRKSDSNRR